MIALQSLKYFIWDYCLTKLFEGFQKNFKFGNEHLVKVKDLYVGQKLYKVIRDNSTFYNCEIIKIYSSSTSFNIDNGNGIRFTYEFREKSGKPIYETGSCTLVILDDNQNSVEFIEFT